MVYLAAGDGKIYLLDDMGNCDEVLSLENDSHLNLLQFIEFNRSLIIITLDMSLRQFDVTPTFGLKESKTVP